MTRLLGGEQIAGARLGPEASTDVAGVLQAGDDGGSDQREHWGRMSGFRKPIEFMTER